MALQSFKPLLLNTFIEVCLWVLQLGSIISTEPARIIHINYCLVITHTGAFSSILLPYLISLPIFSFSLSSPSLALLPNFLSFLYTSHPLRLPAIEPLDLISAPTQTCHILTPCHGRWGDIQHGGLSSPCGDVLQVAGLEPEPLQSLL